MRLLLIILVIKALLSCGDASAREGCTDIRAAYASAGAFSEGQAAYRACEEGESISKLLAILQARKCRKEQSRSRYATEDFVSQMPRITQCRYNGPVWTCM